MVTDFITTFHHRIHLLLRLLGLLLVYSRPNINVNPVNTRPVDS